MNTKKFQRDVCPLSRIQMDYMHTRQLIRELRRTYGVYDYDWTTEDELALLEYQSTLKAVLATREHIPNKKESKALRKAKIKKGK